MNTRIDLEKDIISLLRRCALSGSDREISLSEPIGELGIGLDSLAIVEFMVAIEKRYQVEIPQTIWFTKEGLSLSDLVDEILSQREKSNVSTDRLDELTREEIVERAASSRSEIRADDKRNWANFPLRALRKLVRMLYESSNCVILSFDLRKDSLPQYRAGLPLEMRQGTYDDFVTYYRDNPTAGYEKPLKTYAERFAQSFLCLMALSDGKIVGRDWLSPTEDYDRGSNLKIKLNAGSIYGLDLNEHTDYRGKGIGMALLCFALSEAKRLGYHRQVTIVRTTNERMLIGAIQLLGYEKIGTFTTKRFLKWTRSRWQIGDRQGADLLTL